MMRHVTKLRRTMPDNTFKAMVDYLNTAMDAFEVAVIDEGPMTRDSDHDEIPHKRQCISQIPSTSSSRTAEVVSFPLQ